MLFDEFELGRFTGRPVRLYVFTRQSLVWRFAESDTDFEYDGTVYTAAQISRSEIEETVEREKDKVTIKLAYLRNPTPPIGTEIPVTQSLGDNWHPYIPTDVVRVVCLDAHHGATDAPKPVWSGVVTQPQFGDIELTLTCEPHNGFTRARGQGPRCQKSCWKLPYSTGIRGCNLDPEDFKAEGALDDVAGLVLTAPAFAASTLNLAGGSYTWVDPATGLVHRRSIEAHSGSAITLAYSGPGLAAGLVGYALPTCPRTWEGCAARRADPQNHFGGNFYKPVDNPQGESMSWG